MYNKLPFVNISLKKLSITFQHVCLSSNGKKTAQYACDIECSQAMCERMEECVFLFMIVVAVLGGREQDRLSTL